MKPSRSLIAKVGAAALVLAAAGTASVAQAGSNVHFSIHAPIAPGVVLSVSNAPYYYAPPVYVAPPAYYYAPAPVYYAPPIYVRPAPVVYYGPRYYGRTHYGHRHGHRHRHHH